MHFCSKRQMQQLFFLLAKGKAPDHFPVRGILWSTMRGHVDYEAYVDEWPRFSALLLRPNPHWQPKLGTGFLTYATDYGKLHDLLRMRDIVPWNQENILFDACASKTSEVLQKIAAEFNVQIKQNAECDAFGFSDVPVDTSHRSLVPAGFYLDHVRPADAAVVNKHWEHSEGKISELKIEKLTQHMPSACIRLESGEMVAWAMVDFDGQLGMAFTLEPYRRRNLNHIILKELLWQSRKLEFPVSMYIVKSNITSQQHLREKSGLEKVELFTDSYSWWHASKDND